MSDLSKIQSSSIDSDFYEEGTFTPYWSSNGATTPHVSPIVPTNTSRTWGIYRKIGDTVHFNLRLEADGDFQNGGASGQVLTVAGLPFQIATTFDVGLPIGPTLGLNPCFTSTYFLNWTGFSAGYSPMWLGLSPGQGYGSLGYECYLYYNAGNGVTGPSTAAFLTSTATVTLSGTYITNGTRNSN